MKRVVDSIIFTGLLFISVNVFGYSNRVTNKSGNKIEVKWTYYGEVKGFSCRSDKKEINNGRFEEPYAGGCQLKKLTVTERGKKTVVRVKTIMPKGMRTQSGQVNVSDLIDVEKTEDASLHQNPLDDLKVGSFGSTKWIYRGHNNLMPAQKDSGVVIFDR